MYIDGGHDDAPAPTSVDTLSEVVCLESRTVSSALLQIPNEPIIFEHDGKKRTEDGAIGLIVKLTKYSDRFPAYTWSHFFNHRDQPIWLLRLPMVKAAVRVSA